MYGGNCRNKAVVTIGIVRVDDFELEARFSRKTPYESTTYALYLNGELSMIAIRHNNIPIEEIPISESRIAKDFLAKMRTVKILNYVLNNGVISSMERMVYSPTPQRKEARLSAKRIKSFKQILERRVA
jgi:hypothetical protein